MPRQSTMPSKRISCRLCAALLIAALLSGTAAVHAGEWPQILGPGRNGVAVDEKLVDSFPKKGPPIVWEHAVGEGYAGVAVAGGLAVVFHRLGDEEVVVGLEAVT